MSISLPQQALKITVTTGPWFDDGFANEIQMVKAALLYADRVTLLRFNMGYIVIAALTNAANLAVPNERPRSKRYQRNPQDTVNQATLKFVRNQTGPQALQRIIDHLIKSEDTPAEIREDLQAYKAIPSNTKDAALLEWREKIYEGMRSVLDFAWSRTLDDLRLRYAEALSQQDDLLQRAMRDGMFNIVQSPTFDYKDAWSYIGSEAFDAEFGDILMNIGIYPMLEESMGKGINHALQSSPLSLSTNSLIRAKQVSLVVDLLKRLPLFESAPLDEIIDIRTELQPYLKEFRAAIIRLSEQIKEEPWEKDFALEVEQAFHRDVAPAIHALDLEVKSRNYLSEFGRKLIKEPLVVPSGSILAMALSQVSSLPSIVTQPLGVAIGFGLVGYDAYQEWREKLAGIQQNHLYFYYRAASRLSATKRKQPKPTG